MSEHLKALNQIFGGLDLNRETIKGDLGVEAVHYGITKDGVRTVVSFDFEELEND